MGPVGVIGRLGVSWGVAAAAFVGVASCTTARAPMACGGQCAPPYELQVGFRQGTATATAEKVLASCADHNPVVIRIGTVQHRAEGFSRAMVYTHVLGDTGRTAALLKCLRMSGVTQGVGWPD
jgi:hypothetical protein